MKRYLILYGSVEGHTRTIAEHVLESVRNLGATGELLDATNALCLVLEEGEYDGVIVCAPVHAGKHPASVIETIRDSLVCLERIPSALVSVSLAAAIDGEEHRAEAQSYVDDLVRETGWSPTRVHLAAGALKYTQYDFFKRLLVKLIADRRGGNTDTSRDWVYTDWSALDRFVAEFDAEVPPRADAKPMGVPETADRLE